MPRLTPSGVPVFGLGRIPLDDSRVIGQQIVKGDWRICVDGVPVSPQGCNALAASNGYWIAWLGGYGLFDASGLISATSGLPATQDGRSPSAPDGTIAIVVDRDNGRGLRLINGGVVTAEVPDALLTDQLCVVNRTQALWIDAGTRGLRTCGGLPAPTILLGPMGWPHVLNVNGELWLSYQSTDAAGMVLHPFTSLRGYRITLPPAFYQDAVVLAGGKVRLTWARTPADTDIDVRDIDVTREARIDLRGEAPPPPPIDPPAPPESRMKLPADVHATFTACVQKFPHDGDDDQRREAMKKAVQTIRAKHGLRYVWKSEHSNLSSPSKDGMGCVPLEEGAIVEGQRKRMFIWDMINGGTRQPNEAGESEPIREAYVLTPEPKDWLAGTGPVDPPPPPPPSDDIAKLRAEVSELRTLTRKLDADIGATDARARALAERVEELEHKPDPVMKLPKLRVKGSTSRTFGHGHTVDLEVVQE